MFLHDADFTWPVAVTGYCWADDVLEDERGMDYWGVPGPLDDIPQPLRTRARVLKARLPPPHAHTQTRDEPCSTCLDGIRLSCPFREHPDLFQQFAALDPDAPEGLLAFANRFGHLTDRIRPTGWYHDSTNDLSEERDGRRREYDFERLLRGQSGYHDTERPYRAGDELWTEWSEESRLLWTCSIEAVRTVVNLSAETPKRGDKHRWDRLRIRETIEQNLVGRIRVMPLEGPDLSPRPVNLLGVIWLQVAAHVTGELKLRQCRRRGCGRLFRVGEPVAAKSSSGRPSPGRSTRRYCSRGCRNATAYQKLVKEKKRRKRPPGE